MMMYAYLALTLAWAYRTRRTGNHNERKYIHRKQFHIIFQIKAVGNSTSNCLNIKLDKNNYYRNEKLNGL